MTREEWLREFTNELVIHRPHLEHPAARLVAMVLYTTLGSAYDPKKASQEYHARRERGEKGFPVKRGRRSK